MFWMNSSLLYIIFVDVENTRAGFLLFFFQVQVKQDSRRQV